jgi:signal peptidase I
MPAHSSRQNLNFRFFVESCVIIVVFLLVMRVWFIDGLLVPCQVTGGSMAITLLGEHREVICRECGFHFSRDASLLPESPRSVCPNCGFINEQVDASPFLDGDGLLIDRSAYSLRRPRRWEIVAFRHPSEAGRMLIKRIVGLPGETVQIKNGDVYINGIIERKNLHDQLAMVMPVYDASYQPKTSLRPLNTWQGENGNSSWKIAGGIFSCQKTNESVSSRENSVDWLTYKHWRKTENPAQEPQECPVTDIIGYNQTLPRRDEDVHAVRDLMLKFCMQELSGSGKFFIRATDGSDNFLVEIEAGTRNFKIKMNGEEISKNVGRNQIPPGTPDIIVSLIDRQFIFAVNNRMAFCVTVGETKRETTSSPFAFGVLDSNLVVKNVQILRDIYYCRPIGWDCRSGFEKPYQLVGEEYFVLGDNSPISQDSRTWAASPGVADKFFIGKPFMIIFPANVAKVMRRYIQVPEWSRIGYIH